MDNLYELGLYISYNHVLEISTELGNNICNRYVMEKVICPPKVKCGLFTSAAVDNIDHNPSSTSAHGSFHGTGISLFQHVDKNFSGFTQTIFTDDTVSKGTAVHLPEAYTNIVPVNLIKHDLAVPKLNSPNKADLKSHHKL